MKQIELERCRRRSAHLGGRPVAVGSKPETFGIQFRFENLGKSRKTPSEKNMKKSATQKMKTHAGKVSKLSRNGTKTNENSIQKQVAGNIRKISKNHVSLNCKIIEIHCKKQLFLMV